MISRKRSKRYGFSKLVKIFKKIPRSRRVVLFAVVILIILGISQCIKDSQKLVLKEGELAAVFINVGQGDAALFETEDTVVLIDAGPVSATRDLLKELDHAGIDHIDCAVFTHPHEDHIGGAAAVIRKYMPKEILLPDAETNTPVFENMLDEAERAGSKISVVSRGNKKQYGDITLNILSPASGRDFSSDLNRSSLIIRVTFGDVAFMNCADAEYYDEKEVVDSYPSDQLKSSVLKVSHHGSGTASSARFLKAVSPNYAVISCGINNAYGHPHTNVLERLNEFSAAVYRTDKNGTITFITDGKKISVNTEKSRSE